RVGGDVVGGAVRVAGGQPALRLRVVVAAGRPHHAGRQGRGRGLAHRHRAQIQHGQVAVGVDGVPAAVARVVARGEVLQHPDPRTGDVVADGIHDVVALHVDVGVDLV